MNTNNKNIDELHSRLWKHIEDEKKSWGSFVYAQKKGIYQGFEEIGLDGCRPTEKRFERYDISEYLSDKKSALDIGCNCGFFTIYVAKFLSNIDGVELNPYLIRIGNDTKDFLGIHNVKFVNSSFEEFERNKKYDIIFSLANDETIDGNTKFTFKEYVEKTVELLKSNGLLMWETVSPDTFEPKRFEPKLEILKKEFSILKDGMVKSEYPINVPERRFLVFKKIH